MKIVGRFLRAKDDPRRVVADVRAPYYGVNVDEFTLVPGENSRIGTIRFEDWLQASWSPVPASPRARRTRTVTATNCRLR